MYRYAHFINWHIHLISINTGYQVGLFNADAVIKIKENYDQCQYLDTLRKLEDSKIPRY